jgi:hypothetical protein
MRTAFILRQLRAQASKSTPITDQTHRFLNQKHHFRAGRAGIQYEYFFIRCASSVIFFARIRAGIAAGKRAGDGNGNYLIGLFKGSLPNLRLWRRAGRMLRRPPSPASYR